MKSLIPISIDKLKEKVIARVDSIGGRLIEISDFIHSNPELGCQEFKACQILTSELEKHNVPVERGIAGFTTAFKAECHAKKQGPTVALICEYDALPQIGHACGHNIIAATSLGAFLSVAEIIDELCGTVVLFGTPAEETVGAKVHMLRKGVFDGINAALMIHPSDENALGMKTLALDAIEFTFIGKAAHAAYAPHEGLDALDAVLLFFNAINALREHVKSDARISGIITEAGVAPNIVPERAVAKLYIRAMTREYLNEVREKVKLCAQGAALSTGTKVEIKDFEEPLDEIKTDLTIAKIFKQNLRRIGIKKISTMKFIPVSSDFGNLSQKIPSLCASLAIAPRGVVPHTREFERAAISEKAHETILIGAKALGMTVIDLLTQSMHT